MLCRFLPFSPSSISFPFYLRIRPFCLVLLLLLLSHRLAANCLPPLLPSRWIFFFPLRCFFSPCVASACSSNPLRLLLPNLHVSRSLPPIRLSLPLTSHSAWTVCFRSFSQSAISRLYILQIKCSRCWMWWIGKIRPFFRWFMDVSLHSFKAILLFERLQNAK